MDGKKMEGGRKEGKGNGKGELEEKTKKVARELRVSESGEEGD